MLAVPYCAKDNSVMQTEFSHSDAVIVLTCLSYYYDGLSDKQLYTVFKKLLLSDHAQKEYKCWVQDASELEVRFWQLTDINLSDSVQLSQKIFSSLQLIKAAINFYMSSIVFLKEMKEFSHKLSFSDWDIAWVKVHLTTDFSEINNSRYILSLFISQCDLSLQLHINTAVLNCLLQSENSFKHAMHESERESLNAESLLQIVMRSELPVHIILNVRA